MHDSLRDGLHDNFDDELHDTFDLMNLNSQYNLCYLMMFTSVVMMNLHDISVLMMLLLVFNDEQVHDELTCDSFDDELHDNFDDKLHDNFI